MLAGTIPPELRLGIFHEEREFPPIWSAYDGNCLFNSIRVRQRQRLASWSYTSDSRCRRSGSGANEALGNLHAGT